RAGRVAALQELERLLHARALPVLAELALPRILAVVRLAPARRDGDPGRVLGAAGLLVRALEQALQRAVVGVRARDRLEHRERARRIAALQVHARDADRTAEVLGVEAHDLGEGRQRRVELAQLEEIAAEAPVRGRVRRLERDRALH